MMIPNKREKMMSQSIIDEERGYLDRRNGVGYGWSGPTNSSYDIGYFEDGIQLILMTVLMH